MKKPDKSVPRNEGIQHLYFFPNGQGASVVKHSDLWELAVLKGDAVSFELDYDTEITSDVLEHLTEQEVDDLLQRIENL